MLKQMHLLQLLLLSRWCKWGASDNICLMCLTMSPSLQVCAGIILWVFRISMGLSKYSPMSEVFASRYLAGIVSPGIALYKSKILWQCSLRPSLQVCVLH